MSIDRFDYLAPRRNPDDVPVGPGRNSGFSYIQSFASGPDSSATGGMGDYREPAPVARGLTFDDLGRNLSNAWGGAREAIGNTLGLGRSAGPFDDILGVAPRSPGANTFDDILNPQPKGSSLGELFRDAEPSKPIGLQDLFGAPRQPNLGSAVYAPTPNTFGPISFDDLKPVQNFLSGAGEAAGNVMNAIGNVPVLGGLLQGFGQAATAIPGLVAKDSSPTARGAFDAAYKTNEGGTPSVFDVPAQIRGLAAAEQARQSELGGIASDTSQSTGERLKAGFGATAYGALPFLIPGPKVGGALGAFRGGLRGAEDARPFTAADLRPTWEVPRGPDPSTVLSAPESRLALPAPEPTRTAFDSAGEKFTIGAKDPLYDAAMPMEGAIAQPSPRGQFWDAPGREVPPLEGQFRELPTVDVKPAPSAAPLGGPVPRLEPGRSYSFEDLRRNANIPEGENLFQGPPGATPATPDRVGIRPVETITAERLRPEPPQQPSSPYKFADLLPSRADQAADSTARDSTAALAEQRAIGGLTARGISTTPIGRADLGLKGERFAEPVQPLTMADLRSRIGVENVTTPSGWKLGLRETAVHDANEAVVSAVRDAMNAPKGKENWGPVERAIQNIRDAGGSLEHTNIRLRQAGLPQLPKEMVSISPRRAVVSSLTEQGVLSPGGKSEGTTSPPRPSLVDNMKPISGGTDIQRSEAAQIRAARREARFVSPETTSFDTIPGEAPKPKVSQDSGPLTDANLAAAKAAYDARTLKDPVARANAAAAKGDAGYVQPGDRPAGYRPTDTEIKAGAAARAERIAASPPTDPNIPGKTPPKPTKAEAATAIYHTFRVNNLLSLATSGLKAGVDEIVKPALKSVEIMARPIPIIGSGGKVGAVPGNLASLWWRNPGEAVRSFKQGASSQGHHYLGPDESEVRNTFQRVLKGDAGPIAKRAAQIVNLQSFGQANTRMMGGVTNVAQQRFANEFLHNRGYELGVQRGEKNPGAYAKKYMDFVKNNKTDGWAADVWTKAQEAGQKEVWMGGNSMGGFAGKGMDLLLDARKSPTVGGNLVFTFQPFVNLVTHLAREATEYVPGANLKGLFSKDRPITAEELTRSVQKAKDANGGPISTIAKDELKGTKVPLTPDEISSRRTHALVGGIATYGLARAAGAGNLTGGGPHDKRERFALMDTGWKPNSIRINGQWIPNRAFGPLGILLDSVANTHDNLLYNTKKEDRGSAIALGTAAMVGTMKAYENQLHYLDAALSLVDTLMNGSKTDQENYAASFISGFIPVPGGQGNLHLVERVTDPTTPKVDSKLPFAEGVGQRIRRGYPGSDLPPGVKRSYTGAAQAIPLLGNPGPAADTQTYTGPKGGEHAAPPAPRPSTRTPTSDAKPVRRKP